MSVSVFMSTAPAFFTFHKLNKIVMGGVSYRARMTITNYVLQIPYILPVNLPQRSKISRDSSIPRIWQLPTDAGC